LAVCSVFLRRFLREALRRPRSFREFLRYSDRASSLRVFGIPLLLNLPRIYFEEAFTHGKIEPCCRTHIEKYRDKND